MPEVEFKVPPLPEACCGALREHPEVLPRPNFRMYEVDKLHTPNRPRPSYAVFNSLRIGSSIDFDITCH